MTAELEGRPTSNSSAALLGALRRPATVCASARLLADRCAGRRWCTVSDGDLRAAAHSCDPDASPATDSVLYQCGH
jgi:hypothetical protein